MLIATIHSRARNQPGRTVISTKRIDTSATRSRSLGVVVMIVLVHRLAARDLDARQSAARNRSVENELSSASNLDYSDSLCFDVSVETF